jgi:hypothetical protein
MIFYGAVVLNSEAVGLTPRHLVVDNSPRDQKICRQLLDDGTLSQTHSLDEHFDRTYCKAQDGHKFVKELPPRRSP